LLSLLVLQGCGAGPSIRVSRTQETGGDFDVITSDSWQQTTENYKELIRDFPTFDLHPTSVLALVAKQRRRLLLERNISVEDVRKEEWFHSNTNAIYATLPKKEDLDDLTLEGDDDEMLQEFHRYRHLSRYERKWRLEQGLDLQPNWDGVYNLDDVERDAYFGSEAEVEFHHTIKDTSTTIQAAHGNKTNNTRPRTIQGKRLLGGSSTHFGGVYNSYQAGPEKLGTVI